MMTDTPNEKIRHAIAWQLNRLGVHNANTLHETILIRHGLFCGRKFDCEGYQVVWFLEEDEIKFFSPVGDLLKACSAGECLHNYETSTSDRRAA